MIGIISIFILIFILNNAINKSSFTNKIYVSYGNGNSRCDTALTKMSESEIIQKYDDYDYLKIDKIGKVQNISYDQLKDMIAETADNSFEYGIIIDNNVVLISEEINSTNIFDYEEDDIDFDNLNMFLQSIVKTYSNYMKHMDFHQR